MEYNIKYQDTEVTIHDPQNTFTPQTVQLFARSLVHVTTKAIGGIVKELVITLGNEINEIKLIRFEQQKILHIAKFQSLARLFGDALNDIESKNHRLVIKNELEKRLTEQYEIDMQKMMIF